MTESFDENCRYRESMKRLCILKYAPYQELTQVLRLSRPRRERRNWLREFGIFGPVASVEGMSIVVFDIRRQQ